jgi:hypothetical protein
MFTASTTTPDTILMNGQSKTYDLRYNIKENTKFTLSFETIGKQITKQCGENVEAKITSTGNLVFNVLGINNDGSIKFEVEYKDLTFDFDHPKGSFKDDFSPLFGQKVRFSISPSGNAFDFDGFEDLPLVTRHLVGSMTKEDYIKPFKKLFPLLPVSQKSIGESWTDITSFENDIENEQNNYIYTILEETNIDGYNCLKIKTTQEIKNSGVTSQGGMEIERELGGEGETIIYFAYEKGMILEVEDVTALDGTISAVGQIIPTSKETVTKIKINFD